jgi:hypothetical protein
MPEYALAKGIVPYKVKITGYKQVISITIAKIVNTANSFPITIEDAVIGDVNNSWSVFCLFSSAISLMVNNGTKSTKMKVIEFKVYSKLA